MLAPMAKILATDLDGTLFYPSKIKTAIPKKNIKFLRKWIDAGNRVVLVTSRGKEFTDGLKKEIQRPVDVLNCTGAQIFSNKKIIREISIPNESLKNILDELDKDFAPLAYLMTTDKYTCLIKDNGQASRFFLHFYKLWRFFQFKKKEPILVDNKVFEKELNEGKIFKVMVFFGLARKKKKMTKEFNKLFREKFTNVEFSWTRIINEITPLDCNKGASLVYYCNALGIDKKDVYVVGDSGNDITMFNAFYENSFCMRKAYTSVRKYAKYTVSKVYKLDKMLLKGEDK